MVWVCEIHLHRALVKSARLTLIRSWQMSSRLDKSKEHIHMYSLQPVVTIEMQKQTGFMLMSGSF